MIILQCDALVESTFYPVFDVLTVFQQAVLDPDTHSPRCFGFVRFGSASDADLAVSQAHGKVLLIFKK